MGCLLLRMRGGVTFLIRSLACCTTSKAGNEVLSTFLISDSSLRVGEVAVLLNMDHVMH